MAFTESSRRPKVTGFKRLQFLSDIIALRRARIDDLSAALHLSRPILYTCLREDDMNLSRAEEIFSILNAELNFSFFKPDDEVEYRISGREIVRGDDGRFHFRRLAFITAYLTANGIAASELSRKMGLSDATLGTWIRQDDVKISRLFQMAEVLGLSIRAGVTLLSDSKEEKKKDPSERVYEVSVKSSTTYRLDGESKGKR